MLEAVWDRYIKCDRPRERVKVKIVSFVYNSRLGRTMAICLRGNGELEEVELDDLKVTSE